MTTSQHDTVDFVAYDPQTNTVILVLVEDRPWGEQGELLPDLQAKFNTYLSYTLDGQLVADYPIADGKQVRFELRSLFPPGQREKEFLDIVNRQHLRPVSIDFERLPIES